MEIKELQEFVKKYNERMKKRNQTLEKESILTNTIKLSEEVGEVSDEVLKYFSYQRKEKLEKNNELSYELADVIIVSSVLAEFLGIDIEKALKEKMKEVDEKYKKQ